MTITFRSKLEHFLSTLILSAMILSTVIPERGDSSPGYSERSAEPQYFVSGAGICPGKRKKHSLSDAAKTLRIRLHFRMPPDATKPGLSLALHHPVRAEKP
jgi:hypothetical protein